MKRTATANIAALLAIGSAVGARAPLGQGRGQGPAIKMPRFSKRYPQMVTSSNEEIALHNKSVTSRQVIRRNTRPWKQGATA